MEKLFKIVQCVWTRKEQSINVQNMHRHTLELIEN